MIVLSKFTDAEYNAFRDNEEFVKAVKPKRNYKGNPNRIPKVNPKDVFTILGKCTGLIYDDYEDIVCEKISSVWLGEKKNRLFFLYRSSVGISGMPECSRQQDKYTEFHWGKEPDKMISLDFTPPKSPDFVGVLRGIMYQTEKIGDGYSTYIHAFDPTYPTLSESNGKYYITGGNYTIQERGIVH